MSTCAPREPALFPALLRLEGWRVLVVGGQHEALATTRLLIGCGAAVQIVAPEPDAGLRALAAAHGCALAERGFAPDDLAGVRLCIVALDGPRQSAEVVAAARAAGVLVNVVDRPAVSDFFVPAAVDRAPVTVAIGTGGAAPALARDHRARVGAAVPPGYGALARICRSWRSMVAATLPDRAAQRQSWDAVIDGPEAPAAPVGDAAEAERLLRRWLDAARRHRVAPPCRGRVSLIGTGPGNPELLTLRALRVLKCADVVLYDALIDPAILDLARHDARRIDVGKRCGRHAMNQAAINRLIVESAQRGAHVVRLKGGDPMVFGRGGEELATLRAAQLPVQVIPGVTAACAAAASLQVSLTHRDTARALHFVTGHGSDGKLPAHDWAALVSSGGTIAAYMSGRTLPQLATALMQAGLPGSTAAAVVISASLPAEQRICGTLSELPHAVATATADGPIMVLIGDMLAAARPDVLGMEQARRAA